MKKKKEFREEDQDYLQAASAADCTGLIPSAPQNDDEIENYEQIQHYLPPEHLASSAKNKSKKSK